LPGFIVAKALQEGRLLAVLAEFEPEAGAAHVVYPCHRQPNLAVRAFSDLLCATLGASDGAPIAASAL
jgi:DNA-binding transcriptional LysR family regulator